MTLVTRRNCSLCDKAAAVLDGLGLAYEPADIDADARLLALYNEAAPVVLLDGRELCRAPITRDGLLSVLRGVNLGSGRPV